MVQKKNITSRVSRHTNSTYPYEDSSIKNTSSVANATTMISNSTMTAAVEEKENQHGYQTERYIKASTVKINETPSNTGSMSSLIVEMTRNIEGKKNTSSTKKQEEASLADGNSISTVSTAEDSYQRKKMMPSSIMPIEETKETTTANGRWTNEEHQAFLNGLLDCGREWKKVAAFIPTRTPAQIRSHAQKYFNKLQRERDAAASGKASSSSRNNKRARRRCSPEQERGGGVAAPAQQDQQHHHEGKGICSDIPLSPSIRRNVERIIADPEGAQREVENTLQALRHRYSELQAQLQLRRRQQQNANTINGFSLIEDPHATDQQRRIQHQQVRQHYSNRVQNQRRKRTLADTTTASTAPRSLALDNHQSGNVGGSINGNSAPAQTPAAAPVARQINDGEYIALQALLGACAAKALSAPSGSALTTAMSETNAASASGASSQQPHPSLGSVGSSKKRRLSDKQ